MIQRYSLFLFLAALLALGARAEQVVNVEEGEASYYADSLHGNKTASGEPYDKAGMTAAHRTLPFGTRVKVTVIETGKSATLVVNDRGPHAKGRIIDVSGAAADKLGIREAGHARVKLEIYDK